MMKPLTASSAKRSFPSRAGRWGTSFKDYHFMGVIGNCLVFVLQHHCRNCGDIYCSGCSSNELALPSYPRPVRVCDMCHTLLLQRSSFGSSWHPRAAAASGLRSYTAHMWRKLSTKPWWVELSWANTFIRWWGGFVWLISIFWRWNIFELLEDYFSGWFTDDMHFIIIVIYSNSCSSEQAKV